jgi:hypothetical protein
MQGILIEIRELAYICQNLYATAVAHQLVAIRVFRCELTAI